MSKSIPVPTRKMRTFRVEIKSITPYSASRDATQEFPAEEKEAPAAYDLRICRERAYYDKDGIAYIPAEQLKLCLEFAASRRREKIKGKGNSEWGKIFLSSILVETNLSLRVHRDDVQIQRVFCSTTGKRGPAAGSRVYRNYPIFPTWGGAVEFQAVDEIITNEIFANSVVDAGLYVGLGRWAPRVGGQNGRFSVVSIKQI